MSKFVRTVNTNKVTVADLKGKVIETYTRSRKTDDIQETVRAIRKYNRKDVVVTVERVSEKREMSLDTFLEHSTIVKDEVEK